MCTLCSNAGTGRTEPASAYGDHMLGFCFDFLDAYFVVGRLKRVANSQRCLCKYGLARDPQSRFGNLGKDRISLYENGLMIIVKEWTAEGMKDEFIVISAERPEC